MSALALASTAAERDSGADTALHRVIRRHGVLGGLPEEDLRALLRWSTIRNLRRREIIFRHGDDGSIVLLVLQGYVKLSTTLTDGREVMLEVVGPGGWIGEVAVLNRWQHAADATALSRCRLMAIDGRQFKQILVRRPESFPTIMRLISERLERVTEQMVDALALPAPARLAKVLIQLARLQSSSLHGGDEIQLNLSQSELGAMTGLTRECVNKHLGSWRGAGWLLLSDRSVILTNVAALSNLLSD